MLGAFRAAGVVVEGITTARELHSEVRPLQAV
jgi:hypothetical protein